ncbi:hypothetical protein O6H91_07G068100 [Diphasiastrum complanatum]|uniref:Uncharacterized protein n=1 Tax=Diphasiastrum complanatum TaxID=34168 RepID=A0ACC2D6H2_DIPCM|nr:hypothetical protein O6H91_07G068100 [Diphasiastrum complanatum]
MAPKRKASAAAAKEAKKKQNEAAAAAPKVDEKQQSAKKVKGRGRPVKTAIAAATPKETTTKAKGTAPKAKSPAPELPEAVKKVADSPPSSAAESKLSKHIIIEHCKQCNSFKTRALKVKESLEVKVQGVKVSVNLEKPRRGCFEIRDEQGNIFVSLLDMPRPFKKLKELNLDTTIDEIVNKIK